MSRMASPGATHDEYAPRPWARTVRTLTATLFLLASSVGGGAIAQEASPDDDEPQVFDFEEDEISTDYLKPNTMMVEGLRRGRMSSLISVRLHFVDEIVKSAEDI